LSFGYQGVSQKISEVAVSTTEELFIIQYDLLGHPDSLYDVTLELKDQNNQKINAVSLNGDIGRVTSGKEKTIVWNVYRDVDGIEGTITPEISAKRITQPKKQEIVKSKPQPSAPSKIVDVLKNNNGIQKKKVRFGLKLGYGNSNVNANQRDFFLDRRGSFEGGVFLRWYPHKRIHLQPEIVFKQHHYSELINESEKVIHRHNYIRPQLVLGIAPIGGGLHFNIGGYYGYLMYGDQYNHLNTSDLDDASVALKPNSIDRFPFKKNDFGFIIGGSFSVFRGSFVIGVQHSRGLTSFVEEDTEYYLRNELISNQSLINKSTFFYIQKSI